MKLTSISFRAGVFTIHKRREDSARTKWIYDLKDEQGNIHAGIEEEALKQYPNPNGIQPR